LGGGNPAATAAYGTALPKCNEQYIRVPGSRRQYDGVERREYKLEEDQS
jgi:hypothetical protein